MNPSLPSNLCSTASDTTSTYASTDQSSIRSSDHTSLSNPPTSSITAPARSKPKRTVRFQDPDPTPVSSLADTLPFPPGPNLSLSSLESSSSEASSSYIRRPRLRPSSSAFARPPSTVRPQIRREASVDSAASTASAPGELEFTEWLARMEVTRTAASLGSGKDRRGAEGVGKEERKKKRRSWVNLLVR